jgi:hypothetical protein
VAPHTAKRGPRSVARTDLESLVDMADRSEYHHVGFQYVRAQPHIPILPIERLPSFNAHGVHPGYYVPDPDQRGGVDLG